MEQQIQQLRAFNRFYTSVIGLLDRYYLNSEFSLTEVRILYELYYAREGITAKKLIEQLHLDKGYLSRILRRFNKKGLIRKEKIAQDGRSAALRLSEKGKSVFEPLDRVAKQQAGELLSSIPARDVQDLLKSINTIQAILAKISFDRHE